MKKQVANVKSYELLPLFQKFIADSKSGKRLQSNGKRLTNGTITNYESVYKLLFKYQEKQKEPLRFLAVNKLSQRQMLVEKNYWGKFYKKFTDYLYTECMHYDNYVGFVIKNLKVFFNYLSKSLVLPIGNFYSQFYVRKDEVPIITLLPEQLNYLIYDIPFEQMLNKRMQEVKDTFVFGCTVALRFSDLMALKQTNIRKTNDVWYLLVRSIKTKSDSQIQLPDYAIAILKKYKKQAGGFLLPRFNNINLNKFVKKLTMLAGFTEPVTKKRERQGVVKNIGKQNEALLLHQKKIQQASQTTETALLDLPKKSKSAADKNLRFCDLVTTHTMRRTAITTMLCLGMPEHVVRKISGHGAMSKEFLPLLAL
jgi:integrase